MKELELETWEQVESMLPHFAKVDILKKFQLQKGKPVPASFLLHSCEINETEFTRR